MKYLFLGLSAFLAIVAQMIAGDNFFLFNFLDLSLILVSYWAIYRSRTQALFVAALAGLLLDAAMGWPLGYNGFGKIVAVIVIGQCWNRFNTAEQTWVRFSIIASSSCMSSISIGALFWLLEGRTSRIFIGASIFQAFITASIAVILFAGFDTYKRTQAHKAH